MIAIDEHIIHQQQPSALPLDLNIIIVTYNSAGVISTCLSSIAADLRPCILVVDNCSTDETVNIVNEFRIPCIATARNVGYGQAANIGAKAAPAQYISFLNPDCEPDHTYFHRGVETLRDHPGNCAVPRLVGRKNREARGNQPGYSQMKLFFDMILTNYGLHRLSRYLNNLPGYHDHSWSWPHGAGFFIERRIFFAMHGFCQRYFMYMEDVELGRELYRRGGRIIEFDSTLLHLETEGSTISARDRCRHLNKARCLYARQHHGRLLACILKMIALPAEARHLLRNKG